MHFAVGCFIKSREDDRTMLVAGVAYTLRDGFVYILEDENHEWESWQFDRMGEWEPAKGGC